jgi:hypothetical protein
VVRILSVVATTDLDLQRMPRCAAYMYDYVRTSTQNVHPKNLSFFFLAKSKIGIFPVFLRKTNSFRRPGGVLWANTCRSHSGPLGTPAALTWP